MLRSTIFVSSVFSDVFKSSHYNAV